MVLKLTCPVCNNKVEVPRISGLLEIKSDNDYPFIYYIKCCKKKKLEIILDEGDSMSTNFVNV